VNSFFHRNALLLSGLLTLIIALDGDLRIVDGFSFDSSSSASSGRLEIYYNGEWGTICDDGFGTTEANVACQQLGYSSGTVDFL